MYKYFFAIPFFFIQFAVAGQVTTPGIKFENNLTWQQAIDKARNERKYIFVDCYTTWCKPCKEMEHNVYTNDSVASYMSRHFVSLKVQMDTTSKDDEHVKDWYAQSDYLRTKYKINLYPSYLFFSPDGEILHKDVAYKPITEFENLVKGVASGNKRYYVLLNKYMSGDRVADLMPYLAKESKRLGNAEDADKIAEDYINNYLFRLPKQEIMSKETLEFIVPFTKSIKDKSFELFYRHSAEVDSVLRFPGCSQRVVDYVLTREKISPALAYARKKGVEPDWKGIKTRIVRKYSTEYADRNVLNAKIKWYEDDKDWDNVVKYRIEKVEKYGIDSSSIGKLYFNNMIWFVIFKHSNDLHAINKGIKWMEILLKSNPDNPNFIDTYANLLYKAGRKKDAMIWQKKAIKLNPADITMQEALAKMEKNIPTWKEE